MSDGIMFITSGRVTHEFRDVPVELYDAGQAAWTISRRNGTDSIWEFSRDDGSSKFSIKLSVIDAMWWREDKDD